MYSIFFIKNVQKIKFQIRFCVSVLKQACLICRVILCLDYSMLENLHWNTLWCHVKFGITPAVIGVISNGNNFTLIIYFSFHRMTQSKIFCHDNMSAHINLKILAKKSSRLTFLLRQTYIRLDYKYANIIHFSIFIFKFWNK